MPDYSKGKVYKILNNIDDEVYVGSTIESLSARMAKHRASTNKDYKLYQHMLNLGSDNFYIELIEDYPCDNVYQLRAKEGEWIRNIGTLNKVISGRNSQQWYSDNKETVLSKCKAYREEHKDEIKIQKQKYRQDNLEQIRAKDRQKYINNKDSIKERVKEWREQHKDYVKDKAQQYRNVNKEKLRTLNKTYRENNK
eukprot:1921200-Amphidinium_carterae.1